MMEVMIFVVAIVAVLFVRVVILGGIVQELLVRQRKAQLWLEDEIEAVKDVPIAEAVEPVEDDDDPADFWKRQ